jgi:hypothetical protein
MTTTYLNSRKRFSTRNRHEHDTLQNQISLYAERINHERTLRDLQPRPAVVTDVPVIASMESFIDYCEAVVARLRR